jgi:hypothetical protein
MTFKEFDNTKWGANMRVIYLGHEYKIQSINFFERLLGIIDNDDDVMWVRCENVNPTS